VYTSSGTTLSETRLLTVDRADSVTTLSLGPLKRKGEVTAVGSVSAGVPVRNAPVNILRDGTTVLGTTTDAKGQFQALVNVPPGTHVLVARFTGDGFPVRPSESEPQKIDVPIPLVPNVLPSVSPEGYPGLLPAAALVVILGTFAGGAFWYLRRMQGGRPGLSLPAGIDRIPRRPASTGGVTPAQAEISAGEPSGEVAAAIPEILFSRYLRILQEHGISEAAFAVYRDFSRRIASDQQIKGYASLTPGELSRSCRNRPYCNAFSRFVSVYELVRYGGLKTGNVRTEFEVALQRTEMQMGGEDHKE
jgi:hypothetical protein